MDPYRWLEDGASPETAAWTEAQNVRTTQVLEQLPQKKALVEKSNRTPKFKVRGYTRCQRCGRSRAVYRKFKLCRLCLRELVHAGELPGMTKASW